MAQVITLKNGEVRQTAEHLLKVDAQSLGCLLPCVVVLVLREVQGAETTQQSDCVVVAGHHMSVCIDDDVEMLQVRARLQHQPTAHVHPMMARQHHCRYIQPVDVCQHLDPLPVHRQLATFITDNMLASCTGSS